MGSRSPLWWVDTIPYHERDIEQNVSCCGDSLIRVNNSSRHKFAMMRLDTKVDSTFPWQHGMQEHFSHAQMHGAAYTTIGGWLDFRTVIGLGVETSGRVVSSSKVDCGCYNCSESPRSGKCIQFPCPAALPWHKA